MPTPLNVQGDLFSDRGYTVQVATAEGPTMWRVEYGIGVYVGDRFRLKANPIVHEFPRTEGLLNHMMAMEVEARALIATHPAAAR
jgi:hypothetical protein